MRIPISELQSVAGFSLRLKLRPWLLCVLLSVALVMRIQAFATEPILVVTELSPPHQTLVNGEVSGLATGIVRDILSQAQLPGTFNLMPWARAYALALQRPNTLIYNIARTKEREALFVWIGPVARYDLGFVALSSRSDVQLTTVADAKAFVVGVQRDDFAVTELKQLGFVEGKQLLLTADISESWRLLKRGKVDLIIDDPHALKSMAAQANMRPEQVRYLLPIPVLAQQTYLAANLHTDPQLILALRSALGQVSQTDAYQKLLHGEY